MIMWYFDRLGLGVVASWQRGALIADGWTFEGGLRKSWPFIWFHFTRNVLE